MPDDQDILVGTSSDTNANGIPDECDAQVDTPGTHTGPLRYTTVRLPSTIGLTLLAGGGTPGEPVVFIAGTRLGRESIAGCPENIIGLDGYRVLGVVRADRSGNALLRLPAGIRDRLSRFWIQVVDPSACQASPPRRLPNTP